MLFKNSMKIIIPIWIQFSYLLLSEWRIMIKMMKIIFQFWYFRKSYLYTLNYFNITIEYHRFPNKLCNRFFWHKTTVILGVLRDFVYFNSTDKTLLIINPLSTTIWNITCSLHFLAQKVVTLVSYNNKLNHIQHKFLLNLLYLTKNNTKKEKLIFCICRNIS